MIIVGQRQYPDAYAVSSAGPAGTKQSSLMGVYLKEDSQLHNNKPVYQLDRGGLFLHYKASLGYWVIGPTLGGGVGIVFVVTPPTTGGLYYHLSLIHI